MRFLVLPAGTRRPPQGDPETGYLVSDDWNDFWDYETQYWLWVRGQDHVVTEIGVVKIGQFGWQKERQKKPAIPNDFEALLCPEHEGKAHVGILPVVVLHG